MTTMQKAVRAAKRIGYIADAKAPGVYTGKCDTCGAHLDGHPTVAVSSPFHTWPNVFCVSCACAKVRS